jgi:uncharacterized protein YjbJ (UPF0337 family)
MQNALPRVKAPSAFTHPEEYRRIERPSLHVWRCTPRSTETVLTDQANTERTTGGLVGKLAGKAKEAAGSLVGDSDMAREGRLQQAQSDAEAAASRFHEEAALREQEAELAEEKTEAELERQRLENEVAAQEREQQIAQDRQQAEREARVEAGDEQAEAERARAAQASVAESTAERGERERLAAAKEEIRLEQQAREAEAHAAATDSKENQ